MILGKNFKGQVVLLRCGCSHNWSDDLAKYGGVTHGILSMGYDKSKCPKCRLFGWRISTLTDAQQGRREV